jgi:hypothetical protein
MREPDLLQAKRQRRTRCGMRSNKNRRSRDQLADMATDAYLSWREESAALQDAYEAWTHPCAEHPPFAFEAYRRALDREEHAANAYAELVTHAGGAAWCFPAQWSADIPVGL